VRVTGPLLTAPLRALTLSPPSIPLSHPPPLNTLAMYIPHAALKTDDHPRSLHTRVATCLPASYSLSLRAHTHPHAHIHTHKLTHSFFFLLPTANHPLSSMPLTLVPFILLRESHLPFYFVTLVTLRFYYNICWRVVHTRDIIIVRYTMYICTRVCPAMSIQLLYYNTRQPRIGGESCSLPKTLLRFVEYNYDINQV